MTRSGENSPASQIPPQGSWRPPMFQATRATRLALLALLSWCGTSIAQSTDLLPTDGSARVVVQSEGKLYVGGQFTRLGPPTGAAAPLNSTTGAPLWLPKIVGNVKAMVPDGTGGCYIGGQIVQADGLSITNLVHIYPDHSIEWWNVNGLVNTLALSGGKLYVGGQFSSIEGVTRNNIAAIDVITTIVTSWDPNANGAVNAITVSGNTVYVGGAFTTIGELARNRIAGLDATINTNNATAFNPNCDNTVSALAVSGSVVYAGGSFSNVGGQARSRLVALDTAVGTVLAWNPGSNNSVLAIAVSG